MTPIELRLRKRIDALTDQRDAALEAVEVVLGDSDVLEERLRLRTSTLRSVKASRDMWKRRATDAEATLNQIYRSRRNYRSRRARVGAS